MHVGMDLSRKRLDICVKDEAGNTLEEDAYPPDRDGLAHLARHAEDTYGKQQFLGVIESTNSARFVHDRLEELGWSRSPTRSR